MITPFPQGLLPRLLRPGRPHAWLLAICLLLLDPARLCAAAPVREEPPAVAPPEQEPPDEPPIEPRETEPVEFAVPPVASSPLTARAIQEMLKRDGYCRIPPGTHILEEPIQLGPDQLIEGCGKASVLKYAGKGEWAILFGDATKPNYGCYLDSLAVYGGGVWCRRFGQHCGIDRVWIISAPGDGLRIEGIGDKFVARDVIAWDCRGNGIAVRAGVTNNGLVLDHCNAQGSDGHGLLLETVTWRGQLAKTVVRDCTIQGNGRGGKVGSEVMIRGWVHGIALENIWIESPQRKRNPVPVGIRVEASKPFEDPRTGKPTVRRPAWFRIGGMSAIHLAPRAIEFAACKDIRLDQLSISPNSAKVYWKGDPLRGRSTHTTKPAGEMWLMSEDEIVADPDLTE